MGPRCFKCLMFIPSGPVELVCFFDLRASEVCAIVNFIVLFVVTRFFCGFFYSVFLFCAWLCL